MVGCLLTWQASLYERIARRRYTTSNEHSAIDVEAASKRPFPFYTGSTDTCSTHLSLVATTIRAIDLTPPATILEYGPGWGNTTIILAQMGFEVTAIDIEQNFVQLIQRRAERLDLNVDARVGGFLDIDSIDSTYDAILFFECFHHCSDHVKLIEALDRRVRPGGKVIFAAEPILPDFPVPWGVRLDGEALWAMRSMGWLELGFREDYFLATLDRYGWECSRDESKDASFVSFFVARRKAEKPSANGPRVPGGGTSIAAWAPPSFPRRVVRKLKRILRF